MPEIHRPSFVPPSSRRTVPMSRDLALMPATELLENYRAKRLSPVEATQAALKRIAELNGTLNAFCLVDETAALAAARASEQRWREGKPRSEEHTSELQSLMRNS